MRRDLLGANSLEQSLHVVVVAERDGMLSRVVRVLVALLHLGKLVSIVGLAISGLILRILPVDTQSRNVLDTEIARASQKPFTYWTTVLLAMAAALA